MKSERQIRELIQSLNPDKKRGYWTGFIVCLEWMLDEKSYYEIDNEVCSRLES